MASIVAENKSLVVREGDLDRLRVPSDIIAAAGATFDDGDGVNWQVQDFGAQGKLIVGTVIKSARGLPEFARKPPTPPARAAAPAATKKGGGKKGQTAAAPLPGAAAVPAGVGGMFAAVSQVAAPVDDDDYLDDGPLPAGTPAALPPSVAYPSPPAPAALPQAPAPTPKGAKKGGGAKKGAVAYQVPGQPTGIGTMFS